MKHDVVIIGSGMSGMVAAAKAVSENKKTMIITKGQGMLSLTSGCIDFWGYQLDNPKIPASNPYEEICKLVIRKPEHPYARVLDVIEESADFLKGILQTSSYDLTGSVYENLKVLTALGTERITALAPSSMIIKDSDRIKKIIAVGFKNYVDFFPQMFLDNLNKTSFPETEKIPITIDLGIKENIRSNHLSYLLEREDVLSKVIYEIKQNFRKKDNHKDPDSSVLIVFPAVLGGNPNQSVWKKLKQLLPAQIIEVPGLPPSILGQRLYQALTIYIRKCGVEIKHNCEVTDFNIENGKITSVVVKDSSNTLNSIEAEGVILATGSFMGGGLVAKKGSIIEPIFKLPVINIAEQADENHFLSTKGQAFLDAGLSVDDQLRPSININNLYAVGNVLAYTNYAAEKSGLGVALATGYKAGSLA